MVKGTNKRIIEINGEEGSCFERIVLFVRPEQDTKSEERMLKMAQDYADGLFKSSAPVSILTPPRRRRFDARRLAVAGLIALLAVGALALCAVML